MSNDQIKILLIRDNAEAGDLLLKILSEAKAPPFHVECADTVQAGIERLTQGGIDAVLLDHSSSGSQSPDTIAMLHTEAPKVPIIVLKGSDEDTLPFEDVRKGAQEYIIKDQIDGRELSRTIRYAIERKRMEEDLERQAIHDTLTDLYNRRYFTRRIEEEISRADRNGCLLAVLLCDLDHFKAINDTLGHHVGDEVLKAVARSVRDSTRGTDLAFRWGGDEIAVILSNTTREGVLIAADRIRRGIHQIGQGVHLDLDASIGISLYPEHGLNEDELLRVADRALYIAKKGRDKIHIGEEEYRVDEHSIQVVFQPIVHVQPVVDIRSDQVIGYEAFSRDPEGKLSITELFQKYKAIGKLTELKCICLKVQLRAAQETRIQRVFINADFNVLSKMEPLSKPPGMEVILDISELEALDDVGDYLTIARKWRECGYKFAIDDFGAGFISLPFIARLIPEYIKVDRSTILQAVNSEDFRKVLKELLLALRSCSKDGIIAEGIETEKELQAVKDMNINIVQGFLYGKPQALKSPKD